VNKPKSCGLFATALVILGALAAQPAHAQGFFVMYNFGSTMQDPQGPTSIGAIAQGRDGDLYSTTPYGGAFNNGTVFRMSASGNPFVLYSFDTKHGHSFSGLTLGTDGNFYGTTINGGKSNVGTIFKITPKGNFSVLYTFTNGTDGASPNAPPIQGVDGNFYGTTSAAAGFQYGGVYRLTPAGKFTPLYSFDNTNGAYPLAPLVQGTDGNFYGTANGGGSGSNGVVFKLTPAGKIKVLHSFNGTDGGNIRVPVIQGTDGNIYGTTFFGGTGSAGVVFRITPAGQYTIVHSMNGNSDGGFPDATVAQAGDGKFYGVTLSGGSMSNGTIFSVDAKSKYSVLFNFDGGANGASAAVAPFQRTNGVLYGDTYVGGTGSFCACGVFYKLQKGLKPFVSFLPQAAKVGKTVGILGQGFHGVTGVSFNGTAAKFTVVSLTYLTAVVPTGAKTGLVTVKIPGGNLTSIRKFRVLP
jgi:uncharacterized repeat protein (TIGR03803 family)